MDNLLGRVDALEHQLHTLQQQTRAVERRLRWWRRLACGVVGLALLMWALPFGTAQEDSPAGGQGSLTQRLVALEHKLRHLTSATDQERRPEVVITGANLRIVNGLGSTTCTDAQGEPIPDCPNGLGNLIVGYNELRTAMFETNICTGSHNVVVGQLHNFSRFGGLMVGVQNTISGDFAAVTGGMFHTASGEASVVSGGGGGRSTLVFSGATPSAGAAPWSAAGNSTRPAASSPWSAAGNSTRPAVPSPWSAGGARLPKRLRPAGRRDRKVRRSL